MLSVDLVILDFDGVLTDNRVYVFQDGREAVVCHRGDGWGIELLRAAQIELLILSTETNPVVSERAKKLNIDCLQGCQDKSNIWDDHHAICLVRTANNLALGICMLFLETSPLHKGFATACLQLPIPHRKE